MKKHICFWAVLMLVLTLVPTAGAQQLQVRGTLLTDASQDETSLWVRTNGSVAVDELIVLESRDGTLRASYRVRHVFGNHVLVTEFLREDWLAGSRVLQ